MIKATIETIRKNPQARLFKPVLLPIWLRMQCTVPWQTYQEFIRQKRPSRPLQIFSIGLPKTGTHSIDQMFKCRSAHEPEVNILLYLYKQHRQGKMSLEEQIRVLRIRDTWLWLELESNWMLGLVIEALVGAFPDAKYVLTVREPLSWLESQINQELEIGHREPFSSAFAYMFGGQAYSKHDQILEKYGHYSVAGYLSFWAKQNQRILETVPKDQLIIVPTAQITPQAELISEFVGVPEINQQLTHSYARNHKTLKLLELLDSNYLSEQVIFYTSQVQKLMSERLANSSLSRHKPISTDIY